MRRAARSVRRRGDRRRKREAALEGQRPVRAETGREEEKTEMGEKGQIPVQDP